MLFLRSASAVLPQQGGAGREGFSPARFPDAVSVRQNCVRGRDFRLGRAGFRIGWRGWGTRVALTGMLAPACVAQVTLQGRVLDENNVPVAGARVWLQSATLSEAGSVPQRSVSDAGGSFVLALPQGGEYLIHAEAEGYFPLRDRPIGLREGTNEITLILNPLRELFESVQVTASPPAVDLAQTASPQSLQSTEIVLQPYPNTHDLRNALRLLPQVVEDSLGGLHINGGEEEQTLYTLDGFNLGDPLTGRFESTLSPEAVRSLELSGGRYSAEFGKGSAGVLALRTEPGGDKFRYSATNFVPGIAHRKRWLINTWTPRFNFSGPWKKGRAWFSDSLAGKYTQTVVEDLPAGQDRVPSWRLSNLWRNQINLSPSNILHSGFLLNHWNARRTGLSVLDPPETTVDRWSRQYFVFLKDQIYFRNGVLFEMGYAANRIAARETPQGPGVYRLTPRGRQGNFFLTADRKARRDQWLANLFFPPFTALGSHQFKVGADWDWLHYRQNARRTSYETYGAEGTLLSRATFGGNVKLSRSNLEVSSYLQDTWGVQPSLFLSLGLRQDWDRILGNLVLSPRLGFSWAPPGTERTKISGGYAVIYDATNLELFTQPLDQYALTTTWRPDGTLESGPAATVYTIGRQKLSSPRSGNWSVSLEQGLPGGMVGQVEYLRRRGRDGFAYLNTLGLPSAPPPPNPADFGATAYNAIYTLENLRRDTYDALQATVRQTLAHQYEWLASYQRSRALSNAAVNRSVDQPLLLSENAGRLPWDSPNRFLSWGSLPIPPLRWSVSYLLEWRTGFPFLIQDDTGRVLGTIPDHRFPNYFELNLFLERRFRFRGHWWAFRFGFNNLTKHQNPTTVDNNTASPKFLTFYGSPGRAFTFRVRWLGKQP